MTDDRDDSSEQLDGDVLGERPGDIDRPGVHDYPPEHPLGVEDPSLFDDDDLATRADLRMDIEADGAPDVLLVDPSPIDGSDHDETMFGAGDPPDPSYDISAEEAAIHLVPETTLPLFDDESEQPT